MTVGSVYVVAVARGSCLIHSVCLQFGQLVPRAFTRSGHQLIVVLSACHRALGTVASSTVYQWYSNTFKQTTILLILFVIETFYKRVVFETFSFYYI